MPKVSVIFVNHNSDHYLLESVRSLVNSTKYAPYEIIIVDNNSTDNSLGLVERQYPDIRIVRNPRNEGFAKANNQGMKIGEGDYYLLINNDVYVKNDILKIFVEFMEEHPEAGACGGKLLNKNGRVQQQCKRGFPTPWNIFSHLTGLSKLFPKSRLFAGYLITYIDPDKVAEVDSLSGACMFVRKEVIETSGGMDESFFMYGEDIDWCYRIKQLGWKIYYLPQAEITHYGEKGGKRNKVKRIYEYYRAMFIFYNKHYKRKYIFIVNWLVYFGIFAKGGWHYLRYLINRRKSVGSNKG